MNIGRYTAILVITAFFAVMWGLLLQNNVDWSSSPEGHPNYGAIMGQEQQDRKIVWSIYYATSRVGRSITTIQRRKDDIQIVSRTNLNLGKGVQLLARVPDHLNVMLRADVSTVSGIRSIKIVCDQLDIRLHGVRQGDTLKVRGHVGEQMVENTIQVDQKVFVGQMLAPMSRLSPLSFLQSGQAWTVEIFNPLLGGFQEVNVVYKGKTEHFLQGRAMMAHRVVFRTDKRSWESYLNEEGEILQQGTPYGLKLIREDRADKREDVETEETGGKGSAVKEGSR